MKLITDILQHIAYSIANKEYVWTDQERAAIKDNCHVAGEWSDLYISINAFLNTNGGFIIIGINDDEHNSRYVFNGFDTRNRAKLSQLFSEFTDSEKQLIDVREFVRFEAMPFLSGEVMVVYIDALPDSLKPAFYKGSAYQRTVSGDSRIPGAKQIVADTAIPETEITNNEVSEEPAAEIDEQEKTPTYQQLYSAELINIFGPDYISLDPDLKVMLSFIYECNKAPEKIYPDADDVCNRLWEIKGAGSNAELEMHKKKTKKTLFLLEKNEMIIRIKARYRINTDYVVVRNLFN